MKALTVVIVCWWIAHCLGRTVLSLIFRQRDQLEEALGGWERAAIASAIGLGVIAYGVFGLGLLGFLTPPALILWLAACLAAGAPGTLTTARGLAQLPALIRRRLSGFALNPGALFDVTLAIGIVGFASVALAACFSPPGGHAWDALAYHLADPKVYLQHGRIALLPTEHHSNFPFTMEMLFTIGLAFDGYPAANLFHLLTGGLLTAAIYGFGRRWYSPRAGLIAAAIFVSTPLVLWESSVAYIDLGLSLFVLTSALCLLRATGSGGSQPTRGSFGLCLVAGLLMGFALGIKYLALVPFGLLLVIAVLRRVPVRRLALFALVAIAIGCPWYIKNSLWLRNPVYPFAYGVFPHSRYWSAGRAAPYSEEQASFGLPHRLSTPSESLRNLAMTPWLLVANPERYTNQADFTFTSLIGGLYAGLMLSLVFQRKRRGDTDLAILTAALFAAWFFISQHIRYLIPILPFAALLCGAAADSWIGRRSSGPAARPERGPRSIIVNSVAPIVTCACVLGQFALTAWGLAALPVSGREVIDAEEAGLEPTALSVQEAFGDATQPQERARHLRRLNSFGASEWINTHAGMGEGVVLYEDVHGFYLDRPYLWGNGEHSAYIPYERMSSGSELTAWLRGEGIRYAIINLNNSPSNQEHGQLPDEIELITPILKTWYDGKGQGWRKLVGEEISRAHWPVRYVHHGVAVLAVGEPSK